MKLTKTDAPTIIDQSRAETGQFAAGELVRYLEMILGTRPHLGGNQPGPKIELIITPDADLGDEGYEIVSRPGIVALRGGGPAGLVYSAYEFLRTYAGCQFSGLGPDGEYVPRLKSLDIPEGACRRKPQLWYRGLQFYGREDPARMISRIDWMAKNGMNYVMVSPRPDLPCHEDRQTVDPATGRIIELKAGGRYTNRWFRQHLLPEILKRGLKVDMNHHNLLFWLPPEIYFAKHPDWYAQIGGMRRKAPVQLAICTSKAEAVATIIANMKQYLRDNPEVKLVGLIPEDGGGWCMCDACRKLDAHPDDIYYMTGKPKTDAAENASKVRRYVRLVNEVARAIRAEFPDVLLGSAHYADLIFPPRDMPLESNVVPWLAMYWRCSKHRLPDPSCSVNPFFFDMIKRWRAGHKGRVILYEYYMGMSAQLSLPFPAAELLCKEWPELKALGVDGATVQSTGASHEVYGLNYLAFARCGWDQRVDYPKLRAEYLRGMFGAAAPEIMPIYEELDRAYQVFEQEPLDQYKYKMCRADCLVPFARNVQAITSGKGFTFLFACLEKAAAQAATDRERRQVQRLRLALQYWQAAAGATTIQDKIAAAEQQIGAWAADGYLKLAAAVREPDSWPHEGWLDRLSAWQGWLAEFRQKSNHRVFDRMGKLVCVASASAPVAITVTCDGRVEPPAQLSAGQTVKWVAEAHMRVEADNQPGVALSFNGIAFQGADRRLCLDVSLGDDPSEPGGKKIVWQVLP